MLENLQKLWQAEPLKCQQMLWPKVQFFDKQRDMIHSVRDNKETIVVAGNMLGKDFTAAFIVLWFFLVHDFVRIVTTSVKDDHLRILWDEMGKYIRTSALPLRQEDGGPWVITHHSIRKCVGSAEGIEQSYILGQVSMKGEGMSGHHAKESMIVIDEASGVEQVVMDHASEWAGKKLVFGNPNPCNNFFFRGVKEGDIKFEDNGHYMRKVIRICAEDSPNVRLALAEKKRGASVSNIRLLPGVLPYDEYILRRKTWDKVMQCIKLDAEFYEGAEILMFPPEWLNAAEQYATTLPAVRKGKVIGIDTAEGGDDTCWAVADEQGLIKLISMKTPDTSVIGGRTIALMKEFNVPAKSVIFDQGGGGQEHADYLRSKGHKVRTVSFGEAVGLEPTRHLQPWEEKQHGRRERYTYKNRRAQMYWLLRQRLNPEDGAVAFGLPREYNELRRQLAPIPLTYDEEGRVYLLPKRRKPTSNTTNTTQSLQELIGCSPDEADALVMAVYAMEPSGQAVTLKPMF